ncbi:MAG TPA: PAS domain-containing protein [Elusimicrobiota bacterium]|nr:PAS domain-containing protein [Elusimicrobiota bacterium]
MAAFGLAFALLGAFTFQIRRTVTRITEESRTAAGSAQAAAEAESLNRLQLITSVARGAVLALALLALLGDMGQREKIEDALRRSRDQALEAAEGRRVAQAEAEKLGERLSAVLDHVDVGIVVADASGAISLYNVAAERIHGAWRDEIERLSRAGNLTAMREDGKTPFASGDDPFGRALKGETVRGERVFFRTPFRPNGYHLNVSAVPLRDHRGLPTGAVLMFTERAGG